MSKLSNIIEGHINEATKDSEEIEKLYAERMAICGKCKARALHPILGMRCSPKQLIPHVKPYSNELLKHLKDYGHSYIIQNGEVKVKGCGCRLEAKTRVEAEECPAGKWTAKFVK